jgi:hypothetical protein
MPETDTRHHLEVGSGEEHTAVQLYIYKLYDW